jgi:hypothetical protein
VPTYQPVTVDNGWRVLKADITAQFLSKVQVIWSSDSSFVVSLRGCCMGTINASGTGLDADITAQFLSKVQVIWFIFTAWHTPPHKAVHCIL